MRMKLAVPPLIIACVGTLGCSGGHLPSSPSVLISQSTASPTRGRLRAFDDPAMPTPMQIMINIVGSFGSIAFMPNPTLANMGDQIVFANTDLVMHHIVLDDGTDLDEVQPGQASAPVALMTPTATFHCTIHPTMVGSINGSSAPPPPIQDPSGGYSYDYSH